MATVARSPRSHVHPRRALVVVAALNALAAWAGAVGLVTNVLSLGDDLDQRLPLGSRPLAGVALALVVAAPLTVLAWWAWRDDGRADGQALVTGGLLLAWIVVQIAVLRAFSPFQPFYAIVGGWLVLVGARGVYGS